VTPLRVVLDSNVIISAILFGGPPAGVLEQVAAGTVVCWVSLPILDEVRGVLQRPKFGLSPDQALALAEEFHGLCQVAAPGAKVRSVAADPDGDRVLECALAAGAHVIVSGDARLLALSRWRGVRIVSPAEFLQTAQPPKAGRP